ncbi:MAG: hypothetical protein QW086_05975, partial [Pyrobaculum sp.]
IQLVAYTGNVDVQFGSYSATEYVGFPSDGGWSFVEEGSDPEAKDVGQCTVTLKEIENEESHNPSSAGNNDLDLVITITNGYPGYKCEVTFDVMNSGSVPVKGPTYVDPPSPYTDGHIKVEHDISTAACVQLHPGDKQTFTVNVTVLQGAEEQTTYTVQIHLRYDQWNEAECGAQQPRGLKDFTTSGGDALDKLDGYRKITIVVNPQNKITAPDHVVMVVAFYLPTTYDASTTPLIIKDYLPPDWSANPGTSSWNSVVKICFEPTFPPYFPNYPFSYPCTSSGYQLPTPSVVQFSYSGGSGGVLTAQIVSGTYGPGWLVMFIKANYDLQGQPLPSGYFSPYDGYCIRDFENYAELLYGDSTLATATGTLRGVGQGVSCSVVLA